MDSYDIIENAVKEYWKQTGSPHEVVAFFIRNTKMNQRINGNTYKNLFGKDMMKFIFLMIFAKDKLALKT